MEKIVQISDFHIAPDRNTVFKIVNCYEDSPVYDEMVSAYEELLPQILRIIQPKGAFVFDTVAADRATERLVAGTTVIYSITTIGGAVSDLSRRYFDQGDYVKGLLVDAIADGCLFSMEKDFLVLLREECTKRKVGIDHRYEAPQDIPMEYQRIACDALDGSKTLGLSVTSGYMLNPVKSNCQVFTVTADENCFLTTHDCTRCERYDCVMRQPVLTVNSQSGIKKIGCDKSKSVMTALQEHGYYISAVCGGRGACGKCGVRFSKNAPDATDPDKKLLSPKQLACGWRLSCTTYLEHDAEIEIDEKTESDFEVLDDFSNKGETVERRDQTYDIAIDIGTTTLALALVGAQSHEVIDTFTGVNRQRAFGADVISRIQASNDGKKEELQQSIHEDILNGITSLLNENQIVPEQIIRIVIAGNTTMGHLLMGFSCEGLGVVPFTPVDISLIKRSFEAVFASRLLTAEVILLPGVSTYVGADITAGMYACGFMKTDEINLLVDLGTNGEMAIGNRERILVTSTAAGPAFEGGNIEWGMGSVKGAICGVSIKDDVVQLETIQDAPPVGLCGTGVIEATAELLRNELVDETGLLDEEYFDDGYPLGQTADGREIVFTQKDIREIQLAKAAVRAGVETLIVRYGVEYEQIGHIYLAGGFGFRMDCDKAIEIGMLPSDLRDRIEAVGNSSLGGAIQYLKDPKGDETVEAIARDSQEVELSTDKAFNEFYMEHMMFE